MQDHTGSSQQRSNGPKETSPMSGPSRAQDNNCSTPTISGYGFEQSSSGGSPHGRLTACTSSRPTEPTHCSICLYPLTQAACKTLGCHCTLHLACYRRWSSQISDPSMAVCPTAHCTGDTTQANSPHTHPTITAAEQACLRVIRLTLIGSDLGLCVKGLYAANATLVFDNLLTQGGKEIGRCLHQRFPTCPDSHRRRQLISWKWWSGAGHVYACTGITRTTKDGRHSHTRHSWWVCCSEQEPSATPIIVREAASTQ